MRAAVYYGNKKLEIEDVPEPTPGDGQVKVRVSRNGICGTDLHEYYDGPISSHPPTRTRSPARPCPSSSDTSSPASSPKSAGV